MRRECPYCHGPYTSGYFCAPCIRELVAEGRYQEMLDSYYPMKIVKQPKETPPCLPKSK